MKQYYLNVWQSSLNNGTALLYRTTDKIEFVKAMEIFIEKYKPYKGIFRVVKYGDLVIVSFCDNPTTFPYWYKQQTTGKPDSVEFVRLDKLVNLL